MSSAEAYLTGAAATSAPWLLTTAVLATLRLAARHEGIGAVERVITVVYALTIVLSAPIHVVVSRYAADRLYEQRLEQVAAPFRRALAGTLLLFALAGAGAMAVLAVPLGVALAGTMLAVVVGAQWLLVSLSSGVSSPATVLRGFAVGAPVSVGAAIMLGWRFGPAGYLHGFAVGQLLTLALMLRAVQRALPAQVDEEARLAPAFAEYKLLAASALAYHLSIWIDKIVVWLLAGRAAAMLQSSTATVAWFSVIPAFAWIYVQVETGFYQRFRSFYQRLLGGASLARLREEVQAIRVESTRIARGAALVQGGVTLVGLIAARRIVALFGLPPAAVLPFRLILIGAALQIMTLLGLLVLYYFDRRRDALAVSLLLLVSSALFTAGCLAVAAPPALGYTAACAVSCALAFVLVHRTLAGLIVDTFQSQPYDAAA